MPIIDVEDLTLNPQEVETAGEVIFERAYNESDLSEYHDIETGVTMKQQIVFAELMGMLGKKATGCTPNAADGFAMTEKFWEPVIEDFRLEQCQLDMPALLKLFRKAQRMNPDFYDAVGYEEFGVIIAAVETALLENMHRKIWFNDTVAATVANSGVFTNGTDLGYFNSFDGLFKQIFTEVPETSAQYVAITANDGDSYVNQKLAADAAFSIFEKMVEAADERLAGAEDAFILATRSLADNYRSTLRNKNLGAGFLEVVENGRPKLMFDGIEIKVRYDWDRNIKKYQDNGTTRHLPHRAIMTTKSNIPIATLSTEDLTKLDVFYEKYKKVNVIDGAYSIDAKHLEPYMTVAAY
ncbi:hypothetical protein [Flavobacterium coralii]|uniref:hypothetical protein n=1 Tax=Flavobacterium coralii TaxID=2838017 RepID=UPI000C47134B|nr:hypothetical protein [Flavobacterium sp.]|tara:strand:- start:8918 stop:9976 length:1059 start_codon:yes stop_codon:yes gene_type:complete